MEEVAEFSFLFVMAAMVIAVSPAATDDPHSPVLLLGCANDQVRTYVNATAFRENLDGVLASLRLNLSSHGFATAMEDKAGKTDPVYGLAVCRKYLSARECSECFMEAASRLKAECNRSSGGRIHLDGCFLRYENFSSFYTSSVNVATFYCDSAKDSDPQTLSQRVQSLCTQLISSASANNSYAVGSIDGSLYGLAQCWPTISSSSCQKCLTDARNTLLQNCLPQREGRGLEGGCFLRYSCYSFFSHKNQTCASKNSTPSSGKRSVKIVTILFGIIGITALIAVVCLMFCRRIRYWNTDSRTDENVAARENFDQVIIDYEILRHSTGNFDRNNMLGKGGFGEVFKGKLPDGRDVAVKKLNGRQTTQASEEFLTEVKLLTSVRHRNLVLLFGCCTQGHERLLVYEFMSNNSLHKHLFGEIRSALTWERRLNIILGTARGLAYLHEDSNVRIIHRDIKCGNILLDDKFHPKISDFGLARLFPEGESHISTRVGGTIGYTAPEYAVHGQLTEKADIYSYGIVVLEIVCGRKCVDTRLPPPMNFLLEWAWNRYESVDQVLDIVDPTLEGQYPREQALRVITIALLCTQASSTLRPPMSQVAAMLTYNSDILVQPTPPAFIDSAAARPANSSSSGSRPANSSGTSNSGTSASVSSHGSVTVSLIPR